MRGCGGKESFFGLFSLVYIPSNILPNPDCSHKPQFYRHTQSHIMAEQSGNKSLHDLRPSVIHQPLHNSIPKELLPRFDPVYVEYYNKYNAGRLHTHEVPIEEFRKDPTRYLIAYGRASGPDVFRITEQNCPVQGGEITIRIFEPAPKHDQNGVPKKRGAYVNFHGGGWVFGSLESDHDFCKQVVHGLEGDVVVFDVNYRLAPEHPYPTPVNDCWAAFNWVSWNSFPDSLAGIG